MLLDHQPYLIGRDYFALSAELLDSLRILKTFKLIVVELTAK
ncbi:MAG: hypothetical protein R2867_43075 [Caldilineaceae bacterium]